jgi:hypothetical protein
MSEVMVQKFGNCGIMICIGFSGLGDKERYRTFVSG